MIIKKIFIVVTAAFVITLKTLDCHVIGLSRRQQNDAIATPTFPPLRPLPWGQVNFIHTTDNHGWLEGHVLEGSYNGDLGDFYSFSIRMKEKARQLKKDLFIVDTGDTHDGNGLSDVTNPRGKVTQPLLTQIPYDILTIGNHELYQNDVTQDVFDNFAPYWKDRYLTSNVYIKDLNNNETVSIGAKYTYFEGEFGTRVLAYGFLFDFKGHGNLSVVEAVQSEVSKDWFINSLQEHQPTVIALIGHMGLQFNEFYIAIAAIRKVYPTIPIAVLGGHTHIRNARKYDSFAAGIESGRYLETIGFFSINNISEKKENNITFARRYLDQNRATYIFHSVVGDESKFDTQIGQEMTNHIFKLRKDLDLSKRLGCSPQDYRLNAALPQDNSSVIRLVTHEVMPKVIGKKDSVNPPYFLINTGGIRYGIYKGPFSLDNMYQLAPFADTFCSIENVPHDIADQILPNLNKAGEAMKKRGIWPYNIELVTRADLQQQTQFSTGLSPGYVTYDDFGSDGDDTIHSPMQNFTLPAFAANPLPSSPLVDLVYVDFIDKQLQTLLYDLSHRNWTVNQHYSNLTSSTMWIEFASRYWQNNSTSCS